VDEFCRSYSARWISYVYYRRTPFTGRHINVDSVGWRFTPQFRMDAGTPARSIFLLGGSTMWGTGARDSATIPSALARLLASDPALPAARVVNMGESGYVSTQAILALQLELRKGNVPDLVIMYDGVNDVFSAYQSGEAGVPQNEANRSAEFNLLKEGGRMRALGIGDLWKRTLTAELLDTVRSILRPPPPLPATPPRLAAEVVRMYRGNLEVVEALSRQYGFRYLAYWQPVVFSKADPSPYERRQSDLWHYVRPLFLESYSLVASDPGLRANPSFHDLSGVLDGTVAYIDFCHITERGNGVVARRIYADLKAAINQRLSR
jgi:lysophospholipase L1-like esterase